MEDEHDLVATDEENPSFNNFDRKRKLVIMHGGFSWR